MYLKGQIFPMFVRIVINATPTLWHHDCELWELTMTNILTTYIVVCNSHNDTFMVAKTPHWTIKKNHRQSRGGTMPLTNNTRHMLDRIKSMKQSQGQTKVITLKRNIDIIILALIRFIKITNRLLWVQTFMAERGIRVMMNIVWKDTWPIIFLISGFWYRSAFCSVLSGYWNIDVSLCCQIDSYDTVNLARV